MVEAGRRQEGCASSDGANAEPETQDAEPGLSHSAMVRRRTAALTVSLVLMAAGLRYRTDRAVCADGRLAPKRWAEIRADGPGEVRTRLKRQGESVHANEAVALLELEGEEAAVKAAEVDLAAARRQFNGVARQLDRMAEYLVVVPPPSVLDLGAWLEQEVRSRAPGATLVPGATARMRSIRTELQARAGRLRRCAANSEGTPLDCARALEAHLTRPEEQILDALHGAPSKRSLLGLDQAIARYEDAIFEGLCDLAGMPPLAVRDAFASRALGPVPGDAGKEQGAGRLPTPEGYFELQSELRRTQLELRQLEAERTNLARLRAVLPALAGERNGERQALRKALEEFVARSQESRRRRDDGLSRDGERLRAEIHRTGEDFLDGVDWAWAQIDETRASGRADLAHQVSRLRLGFGALERALDRQFAAIASHGQGLIGRNALDDQSASTEQQAGLFLDSVEGPKISAEDLFGKRAGEVELAVSQRYDTLVVVRARLRQAAAAADGIEDNVNAEMTRSKSTAVPARANRQQPLETARARYASTVARAEWALKAAKLALEAKVVRAPTNGVLTSVALQERTTLARNEVVGIVEELDSLVFKAMVPERELTGVALGQQVRLSIDADGRRLTAEGRVSWIGREGLVVEPERKDQRPWNVLVAVDGTNAALMPALPGKAEIVVGRPSGFERLRDLLRPTPPLVRRYLNPELSDPTRILPLRPEPAAPPALNG